MHFTDSAIILSVRKHGETTALIRVLTQAHGVYGGAVRGASGKTARGLWLPGNRVLVSWKARLAEQLGTLRGELIAPLAAYIMHDAAKLAALSTACALIEQSLPERAPHPGLYHAFNQLLSAIAADDGWAADYCRFELALLAECGFRLDFSACAATGVRDDLGYVSPKSGRAVSREAAAPYKDKLLTLPGFLINDAAPDITEILASLRLTGYFLGAWLLEPHQKTLPAARMRLYQSLSEATETIRELTEKTLV